MMRSLARLVTWLFYRVDRVGAAPASGPVVLPPNHPNALLDPAVVWASAGRDVRFLAKSTLFQTAFRPFLTGARAIPVYRPVDPGVDPARNVEMFRAVADALAAGEAVCVFPEGTSHSSGRLEPLRTGAGRIALAAQARGVDVALVPVGLNFERKTAFRSRAIVAFGQPFGCADLVETWRADSAAGVRALTDRIARSMRLLLVEADPQADAAMVERVDRLYAAARGASRDPSERVARRRVIAKGIERLRAADPARYEAAALELRRYDQRLRRFGLRDRHLDWDVSNAAAARFVARELLLALGLGPLSVAGVVMFAVPYYATDVLSRRFEQEPDVYATAKLFVGAACYFAWLVMLGTAIWWTAGRNAALIALGLLPLVAIASLFAIEHETAVADAVRSWLAVRGVGDRTRSRLKRQRSEMAALLDDIYRWIRDETASRTRAPSDARTPC
jgi:glycerol-3-phosphate O-acyltransferase/dihydroxyacetone phosphate acyltransferase